MSAPPDPAPRPGRPGHEPVSTPAEAHPSRRAQRRARRRRPTRTTAVISAATFVVVGAGSFMVADSMLSPGLDGERIEHLTQIMDDIAGPEHVVLGYLDALSAGNARGAWAIATGALPYEVDPAVRDDVVFPDPSLLIDDDLYRGANSPLTNPTVDSVDRAGHDKATVTASYDVAGERVSQEFTLAHCDKPGDSTVYRWTFVEPPVGRIVLSAPTGEGRLVVNGVDVTGWKSAAETVSLPALTGSYEFALVDGEGAELDSATVVVSGVEPVPVRLGG